MATNQSQSPLTPQRQSAPCKSSNNSHKSPLKQGAGFVKSLLMPGYTDAGASSAFRKPSDDDANEDDQIAKEMEPQPQSRISQPISKASAAAAVSTTFQIPEDDDAADTFSEAATELHDNCSNKGLHDRTVRHSSSRSTTIMNDTVTPVVAAAAAVLQRTTTKAPKKKNIVSESTAAMSSKRQSQSPPTSSEEEGVEAKYDFFPSTKPCPSPRRQPRTSQSPPQSHDTIVKAKDDDDDSSSRNNHQIQMPEVSNSNHDDTESMDAPASHSSRTFQSKLNRSSSTTTSIVAQVGDDDYETDRNAITKNNKDDSLSAPVVVTRRLDASALREQDDKTREANDDDHGNGGDDDCDNDMMASEVSSTASEMGTVINLGNHAERMREIEELVTMMETDGTEEGDEDEVDASHERNTSLVDKLEEEDGVPRIEPPPQLSNSLLHNDSGLDLPILQSKPFDDPDVRPSNRKLNTGSSAVDLGLGRLHRPSHHPKQESTNSSTDRSNDNDYSLEVNAGVRIESAQNTPKRHARLSTSEMMSATMKRLGPLASSSTPFGLTNVNSSLSAPPTPRTPAPPQAPRVEDLLKSTLSPFGSNQQDISSTKPPPSFALRSPGSAARFSLSQTSRQRRIGGHPLQKTQYTQQHPLHPYHRSTSVATNIAGVTMSPRVALSQTFQLAQKCFSFDNTYEEYSVDDFEGSNVDENEHKRIERMRHKLRLNSSHHNTTRLLTTRLTPRVSPLEAVSSLGGYSHTGTPLGGGIRYSQSWDVGATGANASHAVPFRDTHGSLRHPSLRHPFGLKPIDDERALMDDGRMPVQEQPPVLRGRISSDFSPSKVSKQQMQLQTPQRVEIEREDALDILACLVEQGVADWRVQRNDPSNSDASPPNSDILDTEKEEKSDIVDDQGSDIITDSVVQSTLQEIQQWSQGIENLDGGRIDRDHARRMEVLEELTQSRQYAIEMKRAVNSASSWLQSIGRGKQTANVEECGTASGDKSVPVVVTQQSPSQSDGLSQKDAINPILAKMDALTLKALLHSAELELSASRRANTHLNEELSKCRAEIGRLKTMTRNEHVNRSILDDSHDTDSSVTALSEAILKDAPMSPIARSRSFSDGEEEDRLLSISAINQVDNSIIQGVQEEEAKEQISIATGRLDLLAMKAALEKANETIQKLHGELHGLGDGNAESEDAPLVDVPDIEVIQFPLKTGCSTASSSPEHRTVNVRMLDAENFVTDWDDLRPSLPPPPDHGLRSPIVMAILEQWTSDRALHESLLNWMEQVMKGDNLEDLPPLTISSLDHVVRDGLTMHVLPLLLRRADIHVVVQTRAHRQTTYDMAVTVNQKANLIIGLDAPVPLAPRTQTYVPPERPSLLDGGRFSSGDQWGQEFQPRIRSSDSVATSAMTEQIANLLPVSQASPHTPLRSPQRSPQPSPGGYSSFANQMRTRSSSGDTADDERYQPYDLQKVPSQGSIMGALGGALSGLLARNKYAASPGRLPTASRDRESSNMGASLRAQLDLTSSPVPGQSIKYNYHAVGLVGRETPASSSHGQFSSEEQQPYHRVVSAPPGRIGVTFVEFRGHAIVSDVAMDSPLSGWVFPSDVLIAVDEIPVSGMRVRDIVKILSNRKDRQRAMRVISSHDMNEFTSMAMNGSYQGPLEEGENEDGE